MLSSNPTKNSKELKIPPNNINININFTVKEPATQGVPTLPIPKPLAGKKIDNMVQVSCNNKQQLPRANVTTETLNQRKRELLEQQDSIDHLKAKKIDGAQNLDIKLAKRKERSAKNSQTHQEVVQQTAFSTSKAKSKAMAQDLRQLLNRVDGEGGIPYGHSIPTPLKGKSSEKTQRKSQQKDKITKRHKSTQRMRINKQTIEIDKVKKQKPRFQINTPQKSKSNSRSKSKSKSSEKASSSRKIKVIRPKTTSIQNSTTNLQVNKKKSNPGLECLEGLTEEEIEEILSTRRTRNNSSSKKYPFKYSNEELEIIKEYAQNKKKRITLDTDRKTQGLKQTRTISHKGASITSTSGKKPKRKARKTIVSNKDLEKQHEDLRKQAVRMLGLREEGLDSHQLIHHEKPQRQQKPSSKGQKRPIKKYIDRYWREEIAGIPLQQQKQPNIVKIQTVIRCFLNRKRMLKTLEMKKRQVQIVQQNIQLNSKEFWGQNSESILHVEHDIDQSDSNLLQPQNRNQEEQSNNNSWQLGNDSGQSEKSGQLDIDSMLEKLSKNASGSKNAALIKKLKSALEKKNEENERIIKQNMEFRQKASNTKYNLSPENRDQPDLEDVKAKLQRIENDVDNIEFPIRMPVRISPPETRKVPDYKPNQIPELDKPAPLPKQVVIIEQEVKISKEQLDERKKQIEELKSFKKSSDSMMKKVKKTDLQIDIGVAEDKRPLVPANNKKDIGVNSFQTVISPKFKEISLVDLLKRKEKALSQKQRLRKDQITAQYNSKLVSPSSYNVRLKEIDKMAEQINSLQRLIPQAELILNFVRGVEKDQQDVIRLREQISKSPLQHRSEVSSNKSSSQQLVKPGSKSISNQSHSDHQPFKQQAQDAEDNFMQPKPVPIHRQKIQNIFKGFQQQQNKSQKPIISIFEQNNLDRQPPPIINHQELQNELDKFNNQMVEFVEENARQNIKSEPEQEAKRPGLDTNLNFVKEYCIALCEFIRANRRIKEEFKNAITRPLLYNLGEFLKSYRLTQSKQYTNEYNSIRKDLYYPYFRLQNNKQPAISRVCFSQFNRQFPKLKRNELGTDLLTVQMQEYHLQCIYDALNQALNFERPNGVYGKPMPWHCGSKYLKNVNSTFDEDSEDQTDYSKEDQKFDHIFGVAIARIIQWGSSLCGFIPESLEMEGGHVLQIDDQYINHIKQTRMALMLQKTLAEDEQKLLELGDQQTEVKLQCTNQILDKLCLQLARQLKALATQQQESIQKNYYFEYLEDD